MKITKRQLRRIIKEEKAKFLSEAKPSEMSMHDAAEYYEKQRASKMSMQASAQGFEAVEDLLEVLATQFNVREDDAPAYLRQMADRLEGK